MSVPNAENEGGDTVAGTGTSEHINGRLVPDEDRTKHSNDPHILYYFSWNIVD
ncbi:hypothetical protein DPMN_124492 [Dreissena polymorpha]|uniref:Uncharacterized protein n=1 Tax=Dreissena polymorpha TaxID=45954 RepID=A0A9D4GTM4_DREPO|nr:hypothetical protein DPMN_124492 [Dreissena polymorpha]